jgi:hypothetical protein
VTTIRPNFPPAPAPAQSPRPAAALKAFFDIAAGRAPAPAAQVAQPQAPQAVLPAAATLDRAATAAEPPARPLRPGSLLDIRV